MLTPHHGVHAHFGKRRGAAEDFFDRVKLFVTQAHFLGLFEGGIGALNLAAHAGVELEVNAAQSYQFPLVKPVLWVRTVKKFR